MWVLNKLSASRVSFGRSITLLAITVLVAAFVSILTPSKALAAEATWSGQTLEYNGDSYTEIDKKGLPADDTRDAKPFAWLDSSVSPTRAYVIFVKGEDPFTSNSGTLKIFNHTPPSTYDPVNAPPTQIEITRSLTNESPTDAPSCGGGGFLSLSWILCPITQTMAGFVDMIYQLISDYLEVNRLSMDTSTDNGMYGIWSLMRSLANVAFVIVFLLIIYSQMMAGSGGGIDVKSGLSNYTVKRVLPKLIIAAILVNVSYLICALAIDTSNLLGHSIRAIFDNIRDNYIVNLQPISWTDISAVILSGGVGTGLAVGGINLAIATGGGVGSFGFLLLSVLIPAAISIVVAFIILFARQAIITVMVLLAPLAFVALVLPTTSGLFTKWRKSFTSLLVFFPIFAILFGASQLAGSVIMGTANGKIHLVLMGMAVQIVPLFITPWMLKFSNGLLGEVAKMVNNSSSGLKKAGKDWAKDRQDYHASQARMRTAARINKDGATAWDRRVGMGRLALNRDQAKRSRENRKKLSEDLLSAQADKRHEEDLSNRDDIRRPRTAIGRSARSARSQARALTYSNQKQAETFKNRATAENERKWEEYLDSAYSGHGATKAEQEADRYRQMITDEHIDKGFAGARQERRKSQNEDELQSRIHANEDGIRRVVEQGIMAKKTADMKKNIVDKKGETLWEEATASNDRLKAVRLEEAAATDYHRRAAADWSKIVEDVRLKGTRSAHATSSDSATQAQIDSSARMMQQQTERAIASEKATADLKTSYESRAESNYILSAEGQRLSRAAHAYKDELASVQAEETAIVQEWRTEEGAKHLAGDELAIATRLREADIIKKTYTRRNEMATDISSQEYAKLVKENKTLPGSSSPDTLATIAGGIAGRAGVSQAKATAMQTVFAAAGKAVEAEKTLLSQIKEEVILSDDSDVGGGTGLGSPDILNEPAERLAAMASVIAGRQHMASHILLWDRVGELRRSAEAELDAAVAAGDANAKAVAESKVGKVKDMQQQLMKDKSKTPFGIGDRAQGFAVVGNYEGNIYEAARGRVSTNTSAKDLANMDPDDMRMLMELSAAGKLHDSEKKKIVDAYEAWKKDPILGSSLRDKHRSFFEPIVNDYKNGVYDYPPLWNPNTGQYDKYTYRKILLMDKNGPRTDY